MKYLLGLFDTTTGQFAHVLWPEPFDTFGEAVEQIVKIEEVNPAALSISADAMVLHVPKRYQYRVLLAYDMPPGEPENLERLIQTDLLLSTVFRAGRHYEQELQHEREVEARVAAEEERIAALPYPGEVAFDQGYLPGEDMDR